MQKISQKGDLKVFIRNLRTKRYEKNKIYGDTTSIVQDEDGKENRP